MVNLNLGLFHDTTSSGFAKDAVTNLPLVGTKTGPKGASMRVHNLEISDFNPTAANHAVHKHYVDETAKKLKSEIIGSFTTTEVQEKFDTLGELYDKIAGDTGVLQDLGSLAEDLETEKAARLLADQEEKTRALNAESILTSNVSAVNEANLATDTALAAEIQRAEVAEGALETAIATEKTRAESVETTLTASITDEITRAGDAETVLTVSIAAEIQRAEVAESALSNLIQTNTNAHNANSTQIGAVETASIARDESQDKKLRILYDMDDSGSYTGVVKQNIDAIASETIRAEAAEGSLDGLISNEYTRAAAVEDAMKLEIDQLKLDNEQQNVNVAAQNDVTVANNDLKMDKVGGRFTGDVQLLASGGLDSTAYLYIGTNWRIAAGNSGKHLNFEYSETGSDVWSIGVPFISSY